VAERLERECEAFARYLTGAAAGDYLVEKYLQAHAQGAVGSGGAFDRALVALARRGTFLARLADAHARVFAPGGLLRRKLVLVLALLECSAPERVDSVTSRSARGFFLRAAWLGACFACLLALSILVCVPLRIACALFGPSSKGAPSEAGA